MDIAALVAMSGNVIQQELRALTGHALHALETALNRTDHTHNASLLRLTQLDPEVFVQSIHPLGFILERTQIFLYPRNTFVGTAAEHYKRPNHFLSSLVKQEFGHNELVSKETYPVGRCLLRRRY